MAPNKMTGSWRRPHTSIYNDNYLFGFNFYDDMMTWLNKREQGRDPGPVVMLPTVPETAFRKYAKKKNEQQIMADEEAAVRRTQQRIERMAPRPRGGALLREMQMDAGRGGGGYGGGFGGGLRRSQSFGAFTPKTMESIESELRNEAAAAQDDLLLSRRHRHTPVDYDREGFHDSLRRRKVRIEGESSEFEDRFMSSGLKLSDFAGDSLSTRIRKLEHEEEKLAREDLSRSYDSGFSSPVPTPLCVPMMGDIPVCPTSWELKCKQMQIEIEQLNARLVEAEMKLKTEITRIKKKYQVQITELEMSLDVANKNNIELQKTIKKQALQITELQNHYDEIQRQLQSTIDQYGIAQRRCQALQAELDEMRGSLEVTLRAKRQAEVQYEEASTRVNELTTINVNISAAKNKLEGEFSAIQADFEEIHKELRLADERANKATTELKHTVDILHEEQERIIKVETIRKTLEVEVKNLQIRLEEVEANALVGGKRVISKLEARIRDVEVEFDEEKRRHGETLKMLHKKERQVKELYLQSEESQQTVHLLTDQVEKLSCTIKMYKRQLGEQEGISTQNLQRVRRFQRELEAAEERAEHAESNLSFIRAKHRSWVTSSQVPGNTKQVYVVEEHRHESF